MKKRLLASLFATALSLGVMAAPAYSQSCDDPLTSQLGHSFCHQLFEDLAPGAYNVSFEYQAERSAGNFDKTLHFGFLFDSESGSPTASVLSDSTATPGWNSYSFLTQAGGDAALGFTLLGLYPESFNVAVQNVSLVAAVPEPATYALMLAGLGAMVMVGRRRRNS